MNVGTPPPPAEDSPLVVVRSRRSGEVLRVLELTPAGYVRRTPAPVSSDLTGAVPWRPFLPLYADN